MCDLNSLIQLVKREFSPGEEKEEKSESIEEGVEQRQRDKSEQGGSEWG